MRNWILGTRSNSFSQSNG